MKINKQNIQKNYQHGKDIWNKISEEIEVKKSKLVGEVEFFQYNGNDGRFAVKSDEFIYRLDIQKHSIEESLTRENSDFMSTDYFKTIYKKVSYNKFYKKVFEQYLINKKMFKSTLNITKKLHNGFRKFIETNKHLHGKIDYKDFPGMEIRTATKKKRRAKKRKNK